MKSISAQARVLPRVINSNAQYSAAFLNQFLKLPETENPSPKTIDKYLDCNIILIDYFKLKRRRR